MFLYHYFVDVVYIYDFEKSNCQSDNAIINKSSKSVKIDLKIKPIEDQSK